MPIASFAQIAQLLREHSDTFRASVHQRLHQEQLEAFSPLPARPEHFLPELAAAAAWVLDHCVEPRAGHRPELSGKVADRLDVLGRTHRRFGYPPAAYANFSTALCAGLRAVVRESGHYYSLAVACAEDLSEVACARMAQAALDDARAGQPAASAGTVTAVERPARRIAVVTVDTGLPMPYEPGQRVPVTASFVAGGRWVPLAPAAPSDEMGQVQFHLDLSEGSPSRDLGRTKPGDRWTFGRPEAGLALSESAARPVVMIAHGTGWSALRALVMDMLTWTQQPEVTVFRHAEYPGELYDLAALSRLAQATSWLHVIASASHGADEWWVRPQDELPAGLEAHTVSEPVELAARSLGPTRSLARSRVLIAGQLPEDLAAAQRSATAARKLGAEAVQVANFGPLFSWED